MRRAPVSKTLPEDDAQRAPSDDKGLRRQVELKKAFTKLRDDITDNPEDDARRAPSAAAKTAGAWGLGVDGARAELSPRPTSRAGCKRCVWSFSGPVIPYAWPRMAAEHGVTAPGT